MKVSRFDNSKIQKYSIIDIIKQNGKELVEELHKWGLLVRNEICLNCNNISKIVYRDLGMKNIGYCYYCPLCYKKTSLIRDSIFEKHFHLCLNEMTMIIYMFWIMNLNSVKGEIFINNNFNFKPSNYAINSVYNTIRKYIKKFIDRKYLSEKLKCSSTQYICIDESLFTGHSKKTGEKWVLGLINSTTKDIRLFLLKDRTTETIKPIIESHVQPKVTIVTDGWASYQYLKGSGFNHIIHIHAKNDWGTGSESTAHIEQLWSQLKGILNKTYNTIPDDGFEIFLREAELKYLTKDLDDCEKMRYMGKVLSVIGLENLSDVLSNCSTKISLNKK